MKRCIGKKDTRRGQEVQACRNERYLTGRLAVRYSYTLFSSQDNLLTNYMLRASDSLLYKLLNNIYIIFNILLSFHILYNNTQLMFQ